MTTDLSFEVIDDPDPDLDLDLEPPDSEVLEGADLPDDFPDLNTSFAFFQPDFPLPILDFPLPLLPNETFLDPPPPF